MIVPATTSEEKVTLVTYLADKIGVTPGELVGQMPFQIVAVVNSGLPVGAVLYTNFRITSMEMACAGEPGWLTAGNLRSIFSYPFGQMGCFSVITTVMRANDKARKFNRDLGFRELGMIPSGVARDGDMLIYLMTKPECRWIKAPEPMEKAA